MNLPEIVKNKLLSLGAKETDPFLVAVSGGADSTALLLAMHDALRDVGHLTVAHLNHGVRPDSGRDLERVLKLCQTLGVKVVTHELDPAEIETQRRYHGSLEAAMRTLRYRFLHETAGRTGSKWVVMGHTADDQAETVLFRAERGMDWRSFEGIPERRGKILRPLIHVLRSSTWDYCLARNISPVIDPTNYDEAFTRSRIRNRSLPGLRAGFDPAISDLLKRMGQAAGRLSVVEGKLLYMMAPSSGRLHTRIMERDLVLALPEVLQMRVILDYLREILTWFPSRNLAVDVLEFIQTGKNGEISLPGDRILKLSYGRVRVDAINSGIKKDLPSDSVELKVPGRLVLSSTRTVITADEIALEMPVVYPRGNTALINRNCVTGSLWVRKRMSGDRFQPVGMRNEKKLKNFLVDRKIPREIRDGIPIVLNSRDEIIWVGGVEVSQKAALTGIKGEKAIQLRMESLTTDDPYSGNDSVI